MSDPLDPLVDLHIRKINDSILDIKDTLKTMSVAILTLARVETEQKGQRDDIDRAHKHIASHDDRLKKVESELPQLRQTHGWVVAGVLGIVALVGIAAFNAFVRSPLPTTPPAITQRAP